MSSFLNFLRSLLVRTPLEVLAALLRLVFLLVLFLVVLLLKIWEWLRELLRKRNLYQEEREEPCGRLPEAIIRRPDPCIYSQRLLQSQGLPVTWNNPDIWIARADSPGNVEPDSYHLIEDTAYIVSVQVHNASTDLALGVRVRLNYRPWSFNSPELTPVETDANGNEVFRFVDVMPMSSTVTQFNWHTPKLEPGQEVRHFCLQASLFHPLDVNTSNNMGQENTNVYSANPGHVVPGEVLTMAIPLFNYARRRQRFRFEATIYEVNVDDRVELELKTTRGYARWSLSQRVANVLPILHAKRSPVPQLVSRDFARGWFDFQTQRRLKAVKTKYVGFEAIRESILRRDDSLPAGMTITVDGRELDEGIEVEPRKARSAHFVVQIPGNAAPGVSLPFNIIARSTDGVLAGGVTMILNVREGR